MFQNHYLTVGPSSGQAGQVKLILLTYHQKIAYLCLREVFLNLPPSMQQM